MLSKAHSFGQLVRVISTNCTVTSYAKLGCDLGDYCKEVQSEPLSVDFTNVHIVAMRDSDEEFRRMTGSVDLFVPDSTVLTWAVNLRGGKMKDRVYGPSFLSHMIESTPEHLTHYFLGGSQECLDRLLENIHRRNPAFKVVGSRNGYFGSSEENDILSDINAVNPDVVWVGLGTPKQQDWINRFKSELKAKALLAVGFAFDVNAGTKKDAPDWMQRAGLTWFYRLTQEPSRLWERYLVFNSMFVQRLGKQVFQDGLNGCQTIVEESDETLTNFDGKSEHLEVGAHSSNRRAASLQIKPRSNVLGVGISAINLDEAIQTVIDGALDKAGGGKYVTVTGVHGVMESQRDPYLKEVHNSSFLSTPDGMPMVWVGRWNGFAQISRVYGPDLMLGVVEKSAGQGMKHFFFGGKEGIAQELSSRLQSWYPDMKAVGALTPPFRELNEDELSDFVAELNKTRPHFLWVGLSTPKQEKFMFELLKRYPSLSTDWPHRLVMLGVGAAFDFHTGHLAQAPRWMQKSGLEWFFRLLMEPRRLFRRYSINNSTFVWRIFQQMTDIKNYRINF
ncbi:hypothetical protein GCM10007100_37590 [Roseibacillus persicicus]|uniref:Glycosyltransferase n=1 Tax=Roseibacillus persicicus TaxID=454148 RepID=A0A918TWG1_9BACT|nr:hypothetical protein GCM10007100_37590 [Roseibacillus persicicus]